MKLIPLSQGKFAMVDDEDFEAMNAFKWYARKDHNTFYAGRAVTVAPNKQKNLFMHRELMVATGKVDHRDGNGLNNQRHNLRPATTRQNGQNRKKFSPASSKFKGVHWHIRDKKWQARIKAAGQRNQIGYFKTEIGAAQAYDAAARKYFGEFANLNFP